MGKYQLKGTKFEFADNPEDAKWLDEGQYQTKVVPDTNAKKDRYFRISVPEGHNARITITPVWQSNGRTREAHLFVGSTSETNEVDPNCGDASTTLGGKTSTFGNTSFGFEPYHITLGPGNNDDMCDMSSWLITTQVYQTGDKITDDVNLEVNVFYEPLPDEEQAKEWKDRKINSPGEPEHVPEIENSEAITGGTGFNDAVEITEGSYSDKIVPGEFRLYKIPVKWGQRPVVKAKTPKSEVRDADSIGFGFHDPLRAEAGGGRLSFFDKGVEEGPISPSDYSWHGEGPQGFYYLWFGMGSKLLQSQITGVEQPYEFAVSLDGEPSDGGPDWEPTYEDGPEPSDEPIKFDSAKNDDSKKDSENDEDGAGAADDESGKPGWLLPVVIGSGLLLLLLIGLLVFLLRRKNKGATSRVNADDEFRHDPHDLRNGSTAQFGQRGQQGPHGQAGPHGPGGAQGQNGNPYGGSPYA